MNVGYFGMRKRIYRISEDKFDDPKPELILSSSEIKETCYVGSAFTSNFIISTSNDVPIRGVVYSSNPYITIDNPQFEGDSATIEYTIPDLHFKAGELIDGHFTVVVYGSEITVPYTIEYIERAFESSNGTIANIDDFAALARAHFSEALKLFYSKDFATFISYQSEELKLLYRGYSNSLPSPQNLDEFLVAAGLKPSMTFDMTEKHDEYYSVKENVRGDIELSRSTWGFIDINVTCDCDFISVEKELITSDFFLGSVFSMHYYVHADRLHAGKNYGKICFDYRDIHREVTVMATADYKDIELDRPQFNKDAALLKLCRMYEEFRLRRITVGQWTTDSIEILDTLMSEDEDKNHWIQMYKAQCFITNKQRQEALWIIQDLKKAIPDKGGAAWAYLLYLCTLIEREESYVDRLTTDIEHIYQNHPGDIRIFWFLLFLQKDFLKNPSLKLKAIEEWIKDGAHTPFLYIEAYFVYRLDPYLIKNFDWFTVRIMLWARKHDALTKDMCMQFAHVLEVTRTYDKNVFKLLKFAYEKYPEDSLLQAIVSYLIKSGCVGEKYYPYYKAAIERDVRVTGIFEAYINSMPANSVDQLPELVTKFFRYNNNLSYEKKALLYANIILHRLDDMETYSLYERDMESFAIEQLRMGKIDENLAICYQRLLEIGLLDADIAAKFAPVVFAKKVTPVYPNIRRVLLYQEEYTKPRVYPVVNGYAYIQYVGTKGRLFMEDLTGRLIGDEQAYYIEDLINFESYLPKLSSLAPNVLEYLLTRFSEELTEDSLSLNDMPAIEQFVHEPDISFNYKVKLYPVLIDFLRQHMREELLENHFLKEADLENLSVDVLSIVVDIFVARDKINEAFYLIKNLNGTRIKYDSALRIANFMIAQLDFAMDDYLIGLCVNLVDQNFSSTNIIKYLVNSYMGPTNTMLKIHEKAIDLNIDVAEFEERILIQALYRDRLFDKSDDMFASYMQRTHNKMVAEAYLTYVSHGYLSDDREASENIFAYINSRRKHGKPVNESMRIALLKFLCLKRKLDENEFYILDDVLREAIMKNQYFGFYSSMDRRLLIKYHLYDKYFIEYKGEHRKQLLFVYSLNGSQVMEDEMIEMYDGLYVKQFILFFGDELKYEIYCDEISEQALKSDTLIISSVPYEGNGSRYDLMNTMARSTMYFEEAELLRAMKQYQGLDEVTKELFTTI